MLKNALSLIFFLPESVYFPDPTKYAFFFNTRKVGIVMCVFDRKIMPHWV